MIDRSILYSILIIIIVYIILQIYVEYIIDNDNIRKTEENFVGDYYIWNWNEPEIINHINSIHPNRTNQKYKDSKKAYSLSCDFSDDVFDHCVDGMYIQDLDTDKLGGTI